MNMEEYLAIKAAEEQNMPPGPVEVRLYFDLAPNPQDIEALKQKLVENNIGIRDIYYGTEDNTFFVGVVYDKPSLSGISVFPVAIIPLLSTAIIAALVGIGIFNIEDISNNIGKLLLIIFGGTIALAALLRKPLENAATAATRKYLG